jgi:hypothetical protein
MDCHCSLTPFPGGYGKLFRLCFTLGISDANCCFRHTFCQDGMAFGCRSG